MRKFLSHSVKETEFIAEQLALKAKAGECYALFGGMGRGKTAFARGFAKGIGYTGEVTSPTFALVNEYAGGRHPLYHFDMYRISGFDDLYSTGFFEYPEYGGVLLVEWSENIENALPEDYIRIEIELCDENENYRIITVEENQN